MKDMLEVKERKINVLQKKIENLQEQLRDKDKQLTNLKDRVKSLQTDSSNTDTALATLEEALSEKERIIERLKEQRERDDRERLEEIESFRKENKDLKEKVNALQAELTEKESSLIDLKEHASSLASAGLKRDSKLKSLEIAIEQKKEECSKLEAQLKKAHNIEDDSRMNPEFADRIKQLDKEASYYRDECGKAQAEVDRLLEILKEVENEKNDKDKKIAELERHMKDQNKKVANLKHNQQLEKKKNAQLLEEVRRREDSMADNSQHLQIEELMNALEKTRQELDATKARLASTQQSLAEKEAHLANLRIERRKQLEEILEMKQEALLAAISEKDANIALLELSASKKKKTQEEVMALKREKDRLVHQLKQQVYRPRKQPLSPNIPCTCDACYSPDITAKYHGSSYDAHMIQRSQTQNRMKLMADNYDEDHHHYHHHHHHHRHRSPGRSQHSNHRPSPDQVSSIAAHLQDPFSPWGILR
uniref:ELKS/RAB6-interacting/CAST family member 2 n=1 Tax=Molossus molossus TaxID=27622 RepID=A0A7J8DB07_MOLMO|nr:ELKS/RAB6-interacting/CAST family member 2 [Molossus molossus]